MATITTKFEIGDTVYHAGTTVEQRQHDCPDCNGSKAWKAVSPAGDEFTFPCPRCCARYMGHDELSLNYSAFAPNVRRLTIGSVRYNSHPHRSDDSRAEYMCAETGVGSGSVYYEKDLFATEAEALKVAELKAAHDNKATPWVAKRFNRTLDISDYQLSSAALKHAKDEQSKARSFFWNISDLFETIREADNKEAILEAVEEYQRWHLEGDQRSASADTHPKDGDVKQAPLVSGAVPEADAPNSSVCDKILRDAGR